MCDCGSGLDKTPLHDGYGIFMCYTCKKCYDRKVSRFRDDIFDRYDTDEQIEPDE